MRDLPTGPALLTLARDVLLKELLPLLPTTAHLEARLVARLREHSFVALVGSSGSGKSSLLRAGLVPVVGNAMVVAPGHEPLAMLSEVA